MNTDSQMQQDVLAELKCDPSMHASEIGVEATAIVVTLAVHVATAFPKDGTPNTPRNALSESKHWPLRTTPPTRIRQAHRRRYRALG